MQRKITILQQQTLSSEARNHACKGGGVNCIAYYCPFSRKHTGENERIPTAKNWNSNYQPTCCFATNKDGEHRESREGGRDGTTDVIYDDYSLHWLNPIKMKVITGFRSTCKKSLFSACSFSGDRVFYSAVKNVAKKSFIRNRKNGKYKNVR